MRGRREGGRAFRDSEGVWPAEKGNTREISGGRIVIEDADFEEAPEWRREKGRAVHVR